MSIQFNTGSEPELRFVWKRQANLLVVFLHVPHYKPERA